MNANAAALDAVLTILTAQGVTPQELVAYAADNGGNAAAPSRRVIPTVREFLPLVANVTPAGARRTYEPYWKLLIGQLGDQRMNEITTLQLESVAVAAQEGARVRRNSQGGIGAKENCVAAMRCVFRNAVKDGLIKDDQDPSKLVKKPHRKPNQRRALSNTELEQVWEVVVSGGNDPDLDSLLVRFFVETGARRAGALSLRIRDFNHDRQQVRLREKGDITRWQPVSRTLMDALIKHAEARGAKDLDDAVFRYKPTRGTEIGRPLTKRRLNTLANRVQTALPWAGELGVSPHWFRHTATSAVERVAGFGVARAFAGHSAGGETTTTYIKAQETEVARAVEILTGERHPLAEVPVKRPA
jgi:integrase